MWASFTVKRLCLFSIFADYVVAQDFAARNLATIQAVYNNTVREELVPLATVTLSSTIALLMERYRSIQ